MQCGAYHLCHNGYVRPDLAAIVKEVQDSEIPEDAVATVENAADIMCHAWYHSKYECNEEESDSH